ncbi:MAG TPA: GNAT family N-acetyltransferase [Anaerolineae bacterium]|nr:GNAT family N-acetyltransferase [Anaerolineae bacterium]
MEIRLATPADAELIVMLNADVQALHAAALPHLFKPPADKTFSAATVKQILSDSNNYVFVGYVADQAVGYAYAEIQLLPETALRYEMRRVYLHHISIQPDHQHQGCGEKLMQAVEGLARDKGITTIALDVWSFNTTARTFFTKQGFTVFNERMWKQLA